MPTIVANPQDADDQHRARRFLLLFGSLSLRDLASWSGFSPEQALRILREIGATYDSKTDTWSLPCSKSTPC